MKAQMTKQAIAKRQAAATHKLVITNEFGHLMTVATGNESDMQMILKLTNQAYKPKIVAV